MTSKVTAKLPLGVAFSMLLISLALFVGCKQDVAQDSYTPPGYGATVGYLTDTTWKSGNDTIKFGAEGSVTVPDSMKKFDDPQWGVVELGDFTYSASTFSDSVTISAKVTKVLELPEFVKESPSKEPEVSEGQGGSEYGQEAEQIEVGDIIDVATCTIGVTADGTSVKDYYQMKFDKQTFTMENRPTSGDKFVGTYYDEQGLKSIQINDDYTFVKFSDGGKKISYWKDNGNGTISVSGTSSSTTSTTYYLYPHALMENGNVESYK